LDPSRQELVDVLRESRALLARPGNDFLWSSWEDADAALGEIDAMIAAIEQGRPLAWYSTVVFAPTGPMQEVSISSGWGDEFLALADRWDAAMFVASKMSASSEAECRCATPPYDHRDYDRTELGVDSARGRFGDVAIDRCRHCGATWLHYHYEIEAFTGSGRWYRGLLMPGQAARATPGNALEILAELPWHLYGGSFFSTTGRRSDVPLDPSTA